MIFDKFILHIIIYIIYFVNFVSTRLIWTSMSHSPKARCRYSLFIILFWQEINIYTTNTRQCRITWINIPSSLQTLGTEKSQTDWLTSDNSLQKLPVAVALVVRYTENGRFYKSERVEIYKWNKENCILGKIWKFSVEKIELEMLGKELKFELQWRWRNIRRVGENRRIP